MILWLSKLLLGWPWCRHKWATIREIDLDHTFRGRPYRSGTRLLLQCERCGDVRKRDLI